MTFLEVLQVLGLATQWQAVCKPLGCKGIQAIDPTHKCTPGKPWPIDIIAQT